MEQERSKQLGAPELTRVAHELETELKRIPGTRDIYTLGSQSAVLRVMPEPAALSAHGISWGELSQRLAAANQVGTTQAIEQNNSEIKVQVGQFLQSEQEARELVVGLHDGKPVYLGMWPGSLWVRRLRPNAAGWGWGSPVIRR